MLITLSEQVRAELGPEQSEMVLAGQAGAPRYECVICLTAADMRTDQTSRVLLDSPAALALAWAHASCVPSQIVPHQQFREWAARNGGPAVDADTRRGNVLDDTYASLVSLADGDYPSITLQPGHAIAVVDAQQRHADGSPVKRYDVIEELRADGFAAVDLSGQTRPAELDRWQVRVRAGRLISITRPAVSEPWWVSTDGVTMPAEWRRAARDKRRVLVMALPPGMIDQDDPDGRRAMIRAAEHGQLVGAILPLRGTLS